MCVIAVRRESATEKVEPRGGAITDELNLRQSYLTYLFEFILKIAETGKKLFTICR